MTASIRGDISWSTTTVTGRAAAGRSTSSSRSGVSSRRSCARITRASGSRSPEQRSGQRQLVLIEDAQQQRQPGIDRKSRKNGADGGGQPGDVRRDEKSVQAEARTR